MIRISFSGIDGTGKSTQINKLENYFRKTGVTFSTFHLFSKQQTTMSRLHETSLGKRLLLYIRSLGDGPISSFIKFSLRLANVIVDGWATTLRNRRLHSDVLIYDRYFYDVLLCISHDFPKWKWLVFKAARLNPCPEIIFILDADQDVVIGRKPEHTIASATAYRNLYRDLATTLDVPLMSTNVPADQVFSGVLERCKGVMHENVSL